MRWRQLFLPLLVAFLLRFSALGWDGWYHQHPDERFLVMVAEKLAFPKSVGEALDPYRTPLNPQNGEFSFFVYGAVFPTVNYTVARLVGMAHYTGLLKTGRALSALFDCLALALVALLVTRLTCPSYWGCGSRGFGLSWGFWCKTPALAPSMPSGFWP
ncbi:MAG: hypothetical protein KatS3mg007_2257 [Thermoanaerobaculum sp.]|nr:MAG: hypothetical protein KatS3mg007_2257 [Thermoanaerobaculum sp.]